MSILSSESWQPPQKNFTAWLRLDESDVRDNYTRTERILLKDKEITTSNMIGSCRQLAGLWELSIKGKSNELNTSLKTLSPLFVPSSCLQDLPCSTWQECLCTFICPTVQSHIVVLSNGWQRCCDVDISSMTDKPIRDRLEMIAWWVGRLEGWSRACLRS